MRKRPIVLPFLVGFAASAVVFWPQPGRAYTSFRSWSATGCMVTDFYLNSYALGEAVLEPQGALGQVVNQGNSWLQVLCSVQSDSIAPYAATAGIVVSGWANGWNWGAEACRSYYDGGNGGAQGGACGSLNWASQFGAVSASLDTSVWLQGSEWDAYFITVYLGDASDSVGSFEMTN